MTAPDKSISENRVLAVFGRLDGHAGAAFAHQVWIEARSNRKHLLEASGDDALANQGAAETIGAIFGPEALKRIIAKDVSFFKDFAEQMEICIDNDGPQNPQRAVIAAYVEDRLRSDQNKKFSYQELFDAFAGRWTRYRPDHHQLRRLTRELGVPMQPTRPGPRRRNS